MSKNIVLSELNFPMPQELRIFKQEDFGEIQRWLDQTKPYRISVRAISDILFIFYSCLDSGSHNIRYIVEQSNLRAEDLEQNFNGWQHKYNHPPNNKEPMVAITEQYFLAFYQTCGSLS